MTNLTGDAFTNWALAIIGNFFIVILAIGALRHWAKKEWGEAIAHIAMGVVVAAIVYFPQQFIGVLKGIWGLFTGGAGG